MLGEQSLCCIRGAATGRSRHTMAGEPMTELDIACPALWSESGSRIDQ
jgi:hypothetical protein